MPSVVLATFEWGWDFFVALGTLGLAGFTAWLAKATRDLASAGREEQRAQWRPVMVAAADDEITQQLEEGRITLTVSLRNIGRGPAFAVQSQLRNGRNAVGASVPGTTGTVDAGEHFKLIMRLLEQPTAGPGSKQWPPGVLSIEVSYYDLDERWHHTDMMSIRRPGAPLRIGRTIITQSERRLLPVHGSERAIAEQARHEDAVRTRFARGVKQIPSAVRERIDRRGREEKPGQR